MFILILIIYIEIIRLGVLTGALSVCVPLLKFNSFFYIDIEYLA